MSKKPKEKIYIVTGYLSIPVMKEVTATTDWEALEKARVGGQDPLIKITNLFGDIQIEDGWEAKLSPRPSLEIVDTEEK